MINKSLIPSFGVTKPQNKEQVFINYLMLVHTSDRILFLAFLLFIAIPSIPPLNFIIPVYMVRHAIVRHDA